MGSHSVTSHPTAVTFSTYFQPKLVLDLATPEGCKAELTWWSLYPKIVYPRNTVTYLRNNWAVSWLVNEPATESRKSILTTIPPSHQCCVSRYSSHRLDHLLLPVMKVCFNVKTQLHLRCSLSFAERVVKLVRSTERLLRVHRKLTTFKIVPAWFLSLYNVLILLEGFVRAAVQNVYFERRGPLEFFDESQWA